MNSNLKNMLKKRLSALLLAGAVMAGSCQMALAAENAGTSGFENGAGALNLDQIARYSSGMTKLLARLDICKRYFFDRKKPRRWYSAGASCLREKRERKEREVLYDCFRS